MAGYMYVPNLDTSKVMVAKTGEVLPLMQCPAYWNLVKVAMSSVEYKSLSQIPEAGYGKFYCATYIDRRDLALPESRTMALPFESISGEDNLFKQHCREGKIVVNERQIGLVRCVATGGYLKGTRTASALSRGWFSAKDIGFAPPVNDRHNLAGGVLLVYDQYVLPKTTPPPDLFNRVFGVAKNGVLPTTIVDPEPSTAAVTAALADANSGAYDLLTEVAELPETLKFLQQTIKTMLVLGDEYGMWSPKGPIITTATHAAQIWLAYRYAVMPLIYSVQDVRTMLTQCKRRYAEFKQKETSVLDAPTVEGFTGTSSVTIQGRAFIKRRFDPMDMINALLSCLQLNVFSTAWEVTKFSFLLDWMININDTILAFTGNDDCSEQAATYSNRTSGAFDYVEAGGTSRALFYVDFYHRVVINPAAQSGLTFDAAMNWKRTLDSVSLGICRLNADIIKRKYK